MAINQRKGIRRLAIAVGVPWFGWWGLYYWSGYRGCSDYQNEFSKAAKAKDYDLMTAAFQLEHASCQQMPTALVWGVAVPLVVLVVGALTLWVYRGFKPRS